MAKSNKKSDIITLEAEEVGNSGLERQIEVALQKENVTDKVIAALKEKYGGLRLRNVEDKEMFLEISASRKEVRKIGILAERICEEGRSDAIKIQRLWLAKQKEVLGKIAEVQDPLDAEIKKYEDEIERKELEETRKKENAFAARQSQLIKMGATYLDGHYTLDHISFDATLIKESDEDTWAGMLSKYQAQYEKNEAAKIEEERKRAEAAESLRIAQEAMAAKEKEMQEREAALQRAENERLSAIKAQQEEADRIKRQADEDAARRKREQETQIINSRVTQLKGVTWNGVTPSFHYNHQIITTQDKVLAMSEEEFVSFRDAHNAKVEKEILESEERRQEEIRQREKIAADNAAKAERERIEKEQREAEEKRQLEIRQQQEEALKASDKTKWQAYLSGIMGVMIPEMKSPSYKAKIEEARKLVGKIGNL